MARWLADEGYELTEWETDLSSQTGASQAGILLGSNDDIPAFRWVEKETATMMTCSTPADCAEIERRHAGNGLLVDGGASRGNLLGGGRPHDPDGQPNRRGEEGEPRLPGILSNGFNVTRLFVLFFWEVVLEIWASTRASRRDVRPRGHRGGYYPFMRAALCVFVRDLIVYGVLQDMMKGRPAIYATFSSYDEVAHHWASSAPTRSKRCASSISSSAGSTGLAAMPRGRMSSSFSPITGRRRGDVQAAQRIRARRARRALSCAWQRHGRGRRDEQAAMVGNALDDATGGEPSKKREKNDVSDKDTVVMGSGNLGLVYLMEERRRLTLEEMNERHPDLIPALRNHPDVGWLLVRSSEHGRSRLALPVRTISPRAESRATTRLRPSHPTRQSTCAAPTASPTSPTS